MRPLLLTVSALSLIAAACDEPAQRSGPDAVITDMAGDTDVAQPDVLQPGALDHLLRLNHIQLKGTHNSYHLRSEPLIAPDWDYDMPTLTDQLALHGVRQVELDVHYFPEGYRVFHVFLLDEQSTCDRFVDCLAELEAWSAAHPEHLPIFVLVEPKDEQDAHPIAGHYDELDDEIRGVWPEARLLTPDRVRGAHATLHEAISQSGWPTLAEARGKALFVLNASVEHLEGYAEGHPELAGRAAFTRYRPHDAPPDTIVFEHGVSGDSEAVVRDRVEAGYLVRSTVDDAAMPLAERQERIEAALRAGAQLISTDFPAAEEPGGYRFDLPGGVTARCNPVTAPRACRDEALTR